MRVTHELMGPTLALMRAAIAPRIMRIRCLLITPIQGLTASVRSIAQIIAIRHQYSLLTELSV
jgi:hypothetical protein